MRPTTADRLGDQLAGLDALDTPLPPRLDRTRRLWSVTWPKLAAAALGLLAWQAVVATGWKPTYVLPGPLPVVERLAEDLGSRELVKGVALTTGRAVTGYAAALVVGTLLGLTLFTSRTIRTAVGAGITALQTMPSIAWFPLAILLFQLSEQAIFFVIVLGAAPSIANGLIHGIDHIPPLLLRAGRILGARGLSAVRHVVLPAAMPGYVAGLKQGWAFAWRSLMAGELLVIIPSHLSLGVRMQLARELSDATGLLAAMLVILAIGIVVDAAFFAPLERSVRRRWGLASTG